MIKCCVASILILCITSGAAFAEALPRPGHIDSRVRDVVYNKDNVTAIDASYGTSTMIQLQSDEKIETLALGDSVAWKVEPNRKGDIIFVKPIEKNAQSNLNVVTDKRIYYLELHDFAPEARRKVFGIRFHYPEKNLNAALRREAEQRAAWPNISGIDKANVNIDYSFSGDARLKPLMVFDDGNKTFFKFDRRVPAIFAVNSDFSETLRNFGREGE